MRISGSEYRKLISGSQLQADPAGSQGTRIGVDGVDVEMEGNNSNHAPVVKLEDIIDESTTPPLADALVLNAPRTEILHRPSHRALQVYIQNRQKWQNLIDRLPHHEVVYLQRVTDLLSGDFDEVYHQVSYHGDDYDAINSQPGRWNSVHDVYLTDVTESKELAQYSVEQKFNRKKYLEETLTVNKVAEWLANFQPTKYGHPIHTITSHQTLTNY
ncbi:Hypothetical protein YALI2_E00059g [Yarrowia lipolytica]|nr:Hypothetical protein YALI2_E00059g [Yarrowia lipolytica]